MVVPWQRANSRHLIARMLVVRLADSVLAVSLPGVLPLGLPAPLSLMLQRVSEYSDLDISACQQKQSACTSLACLLLCHQPVAGIFAAVQLIGGESEGSRGGGLSCVRIISGQATTYTM